MYRERGVDVGIVTTARCYVHFTLLGQFCSLNRKDRKREDTPVLWRVRVCMQDCWRDYLIEPRGISVHLCDPGSHCSSEPSQSKSVSDLAMVQLPDMERCTKQAISSDLWLNATPLHDGVEKEGASNSSSAATRFIHDQ